MLNYIELNFLWILWKKNFFYFNIEFKSRSFFYRVKNENYTNISLEQQFSYFINYINNDNNKENQLQLHLDLIYSTLNYIFLTNSDGCYEKKLFDILLNQYQAEEEKKIIISTTLSNILKIISNKIPLEQLLDILKIISTISQFIKLLKTMMMKIK